MPRVPSWHWQMPARVAAGIGALALLLQLVGSVIG